MRKSEPTSLCMGLWLRRLARLILGLDAASVCACVGGGESSSAADSGEARSVWQEGGGLEDAAALARARRRRLRNTRFLTLGISQSSAHALQHERQRQQTLAENMTRPFHSFLLLNLASGSAQQSLPSTHALTTQRSLPKKNEVMYTCMRACMQ